MEDSRRNIPARPRFKTVCFGEIRDLVVAFCKVCKALAHLLPCCPRFQSEKGEWKAPSVIVELRRKIVTLRLASLSDEFCMFLPVVDVMGQGTEVVEELRVNRPAAVLLPETFPDQFRAEFFNGFRKGDEPAFRGNQMADALVFTGQRTIIRRGRTAQPAFVDAAAFASERVIVVRMQFDSAPRNAEGARHPVRGEPENSVSRVECPADCVGMCHELFPFYF